MITINKNKEKYMKNAFLLIFVIVFVALCSSGCNYKDSFKEYNVGEIVASNRDANIIKLNENYIVEKFYNGKDIIYEIDNSSYYDILSGAKICYEGKVRICYCSNDYLILCLFDNNKYVIIDCKNNGNTSYVDSISNYDLTDYIKVTISE